MSKKVNQLISIMAALALTLGGYNSAQASFATAPLMSANVYYVSTTGNDANSGTLTSPFKTIQKGVNTLLAGDTLYVRKGTYSSFSVTKSGTANNYITISGYNNETPVISGGSTGIKLSGVSYVAIKGFEVTGATGYYGAGILIKLDGGNAPRYNIIEKNIVRDNLGNKTHGIIIDGGSNNKIINNIVYNNYSVGIKVQGVAALNELIGNTVYRNVGDPANSDGIAVSGENTTRTLIKNNIVYDNADDGIDTWSSSYNILIGNRVYNQRGGGDGNGFKLGGTTTGGNNTVIGNISYNNKRDGFDSNHSGGNVYYNNVAYANGGVGFNDVAKFASCTLDSCRSVYINNIGYNNARNFAASRFTAVSHNNIWYSDSGEANVSYEGAGAKTTLASFFAASGNRLDNPNGGVLASIQSNPQFSSASAGGFTLQSSSPAINKGDPANPGKIIAINIVDIGALESGISASIPQAPSPTVIPATPTKTLAPTLIPATPTQTLAPTLIPATPTQTLAPTLIPATPTQTLAPIVTATLVTADLIFADGFETGDFSSWSSNTTDANDLSVSPAAALSGGYGLQAFINDANKIYVSDDRPNAETRYRARFYFDPNSITMASGEDFYIFQGYTSSAAAILRVKFVFTNGSYKLKVSLLNDSAAWILSSAIPIADAPQFIELDWQAAAAAGANNGSLTLWVNGVEQASLTGVDNDTQRIDSVQLGVVTGIDPGTTGTIFLDAFESHRQTYIGQ